MHDLTLVGVHDDGEHLVLTGDDGQRYRVKVDESLRAAVRRDRARLGQLQLEREGGLRPKEIQARIRSGQSAEQIAADTGVPVEHIRRYEGPVLAEREHVVRRAQTVRMRGISRYDGTVPTLEELVTERLSAREVDMADAAWDAWRGEDGAWTVSLSFTAASRERRARWTFDPALRHVDPQDDEARWLSEHERQGTSPGAAVNRRLVTLSGAEQSSAADLFVDDDAVRPSDSSTSAAGSPMSTVDLLDSLRERRGRRQRPISLGLDDEDDPFERGNGLGFSPRRPAVEDIPAAHPSRSRPDLAVDAEILELSLGEDSSDDAAVRGSGDSEPPARGLPRGRPASGASVPPPPAPRTGRTGPAQERDERTATGAARTDDLPGRHEAGDPDAESPAPGQHGPRRGKRASVPSWDDIVFGGRRE